MVDWPLTVVGGTGPGGAGRADRLGLGAALGPGGDRVERLLARLMNGDTTIGDTTIGPTTVGEPEIGEPGLPALAAATPAGLVDLPLAVVAVDEGVEAAKVVDPGWLAEVGRQRERPRRGLEEVGRAEDLEAALHVAMLLATERFARPDSSVAERVAAGGRLWLLGGMVAWALTGPGDDPFVSWATLVTAGLWPVGPAGGRLVVSRPA